MDLALCKTLQMSPDLFFQRRGEFKNVVVRSVKTVCSHCHVQEDCLEYAIENNIKYGLWGGTTRTERVKLNRRRIMLDRSA
jgi:WhiB family transcriptional regulator, redox-sensing transcriptional regulator